MSPNRRFFRQLRARRRAGRVSGNAVARAATQVIGLEMLRGMAPASLTRQWRRLRSTAQVSGSERQILKTAPQKDVNEKGE